jgi:hypothetical protein
MVKRLNNWRTKMPEATEATNETPKEVEVIIKSEEGHTIAGVFYEKGAKAMVSPKRKAKLKQRGIIQ